MAQSWHIDLYNFGKWEKKAKTSRNTQGMYESLKSTPYHSK